MMMKIATSAQVFALGILVSGIGAFVGCSDETGGTTTSTSSSASSASSSSGDSSSASSGSGAGGGTTSGSSGGTGGGGGAGGAGPDLTNGCAEAAAMDQTGKADVTINTVAFTYSPSCLKVSK